LQTPRELHREPLQSAETQSRRDAQLRRHGGGEPAQDSLWGRYTGSNYKLWRDRHGLRSPSSPLPVPLHPVLPPPEDTSSAIYNWPVSAHEVAEYLTLYTSPLPSSRTLQRSENQEAAPLSERRLATPYLTLSHQYPPPPPPPKRLPQPTTSGGCASNQQPPPTHTHTHTHNPSPAGQGHACFLPGGNPQQTLSLSLPRTQP